MPTTCNHCGEDVDVPPVAHDRGTLRCPACDRTIDLADTRDTPSGHETAASDEPNDPALDFQAPDDPDNLPGGADTSEIPSFGEADDDVPSTDTAPRTSSSPRTDPADLEKTDATTDDARSAPPASPDLDRPADLDVDLPDRIELREETDGLHIVRHWNTWYALLYGSLTSLFLFIFVPDGGGLGPIVVIGVLLFLYLTLCELLNETHVQIEPAASDAPTLSVEHRPLPWWPLRREMPADDVQQLYVEKNTYRTRRGHQERFALQAEVRGRGTLALMRRLRSPDDAEAVERLVESYLAIEDEHVPGEYAGESTGWF